MKLWHGIVLGVVYLFLGFQWAVVMDIPPDASSLAFSGLLTVMVAAVLLSFLPKAQRRALFRVQLPLLPWVLTILAGTLLYCQMVIVLSYLFPYSGGGGSLYEGMLPVQVLGMAVLGPISEELIYRGGLTQGLCRWMPWQVGITIPAILFAVGHMRPMWPQVFLFGLVLGYLCWYTGSLGYGILFHILYNGSALLHDISCAPLILWNPTVGVVLSLLIVAAGLALTLWGVRGFTRCADRLAKENGA